MNYKSITEVILPFCIFYLSLWLLCFCLSTPRFQHMYGRVESLKTLKLASSHCFSIPQKNLFFFIFFIYDSHTHTERERERGRDIGRGRSRLHAPGARRGIRSRISRIAPWAKGRRQTAAPPRDPTCLFLELGVEKAGLVSSGQIKTRGWLC